MKERKAMLVINPVAGTRSKKGVEAYVKARLDEAQIALTTLETTAGGDAARFAAQAAREGYEMVISAGGDGTVNEIAGALSHTDTALGILPLGSGNGLARSLNIPQDVGEAMKIISDGNLLRADRGLANGNPFYCTFGIGFDAAVSEKFARTKRRGKMTYIRNVIQEFLKYQSQPYAISIGGQVVTEQAFLVAVCNAPQYGNNAYIAPQAKLDDGLLDITVIHSGSPISTMLLGVDLLAGSLDKNTHIDTFRVSSATITRLEPGAAHIDGDPLTMGKAINIQCEPGVLKVYAPEKQEEFKPILSPLRSMLQDIRYDVLAKLRQ